MARTIHPPNRLSLLTIIMISPCVLILLCLGQCKGTKDAEPPGVESEKFGDQALSEREINAFEVPAEPVEKLDIGSGEDLPFLVSGFREPETGDTNTCMGETDDTARWTAADCTLKIPVDPGKNYRSFYICAYSHADEDITVDFTFNGQRSKPLTIAGGKELNDAKLSLDGVDLSKGILAIRIRVSHGVNGLKIHRFALLE
ncbi:hypothetical protein ACFL4G_00500 [Thermodesulfobacteriota bacterium]